jgi:EAL and modified HD-GYP domain-containing signal transduction protein
MAVDEVRPATGKATVTSLPQPCRFVARQPILNLHGEVVAYELLSRHGWENWFMGQPEEATRQTLDHCLCIGLETLTDKMPAFVHCTRESLVVKLAMLLPPRTTVLELAETLEPDAELLQACNDLRKLGYRLALDNFKPRPELQPLIEIADYVKVDFRSSDAYVRRQIQRMTRYGSAQLVAEKLEDREQFNIARAEHFEFFQGYFFCRPTVIASREIPSNRMNYLRVLTELTRQPMDLTEVTRIVELEESLCYRLLRLTNSASVAIESEVTSVRGALMLVGEDRFRMLVSVAASCVLGQNQAPALISLSLVRARFCELLAPRIGEDPAEQFLLGLLSLVDALLDSTMESVVRHLPLRKQAKAALLGAMNPVAIPLSLIRNFESGAWENCAGAAIDLDVSEETLAGLYLEAIQWATETLAANR